MSSCVSRSWAVCFSVLLFLTACASDGVLEKAGSPEQVGISSARLRDYSAALQAKVDAGEIPGAVVLVAREGKIVYEQAVGWRDREEKVPMTTDSVFRIASMTKPVTAVAVLILVEEGKIRLDDPLSRYIPEFANMQVGIEKPGASGKPTLEMEPARAGITILDLLRHTAGMTYAFTGRSLVRERYAAANLYDPAQTNEQFAAKMARLPLQVQPGTQFEYSHSFDVLPRVVEIASGMPFADFVDARILRPLRMNDSGFTVMGSSQARVAQPQVIAATGKRLET